MLSPGQRPAPAAAPRSWCGGRGSHRPGGRFAPSCGALGGANAGGAASRWKATGDTLSILPRPEPTRRAGNLPLVTYTRGRDLSGSLAWAGGIGGLLARSHGYSGGNWSSHNFYHADGNGNVAALVNSAGTLQASYRYDPYGRWLNGGGSLATANVLRFSSKPWVAFAGSPTSGLYAYGYRFYDPYLQRWPSRDPLGERGGLNLYALVGNDPIQRFDPLGLRSRVFGAGKLCVDKSCKGVDLSALTYIPEDPPVALQPLPAPGNCIDADALYFPRGAWKIPDNGRITIVCDDGCLSNFKFRRWPWWLKSFPEWNVGDPKPPKWPGDIPPYPSEPPKPEPPKE